MHCLPQRLKSMFFEIFSSSVYPRRETGAKIFFLQKTLISAFEVIMQNTQNRHLKLDFFPVLGHCCAMQSPDLLGAIINKIVICVIDL